MSTAQIPRALCSAREQHPLGQSDCHSLVLWLESPSPQILEVLQPCFLQA